MKKLIILSVVLLTTAFAIDGAQGLGKDKMKLETAYTAGSLGVNLNYGLNRDWSVYGSVMSAGGFSGFGAGTKYSFLNEKKGDDFSLAGKVDLLLGNTVLVVPGLVVSKKMDEFTLLGDFSTWSTSVLGYSLSYTWLGAGALFDINKDFQLSGEIGMSTVSFVGLKASGIGFALGLNYMF